MALSGGQKQRVAIASAMMAGKDMLIYDEPTSGLDWDNMNRMSELIRDTEKNTLCTMIITHDPELIFKTCDRVIHLKNGQVFDSYPVDNEGVEKIKKYFIG
jgi:energy-coupling factor transport system ATP-binding protein